MPAYKTEEQPKNTPKEFSEFIDRYRIIDLMSRYFAAIDEKCLDLKIVNATFTADGSLNRPNGALIGPAAIAEGQSKSFKRFRATQHVLTDHVVDIDGDCARVRANLTAMHLWQYEEIDRNSLQTHFVAGGVVEAVAIRDSDGWRLKELALRNTWRTGSGMSMMAKA